MLKSMGWLAIYGYFNNKICVGMYGRVVRGVCFQFQSGRIKSFQHQNLFRAKPISNFKNLLQKGGGDEEHDDDEHDDEL